MTNKERVEIIDRMIKAALKEPYDYAGLCRLFERKSNVYTHGMCEALPAIKVVATLFGGDTKKSYWWEQYNWEPRLKTLRLLRRWYSLKSKL